MPAEDMRPKSRKGRLEETHEAEGSGAVTQGAREALAAVVREQVLRVLGAPPNLLHVQVRPLWGRYWRVNIFVGSDAASAKVANSYFVQLDEHGHIVESTPKIAPASL